MQTISTARSVLDSQKHLAIWYSEYEGREESIQYANPTFSDIFGLSVEQILERKKYRLVNPPETPAEVIEQYKKEDLHAMQHGVFFSCSPIEPDQQIVVVKLRFDQGIIGLFKIVDSDLASSLQNLQDLDEDFLDLIKQLCPDLN